MKRPAVWILLAARSRSRRPFGRRPTTSPRRSRSSRSTSPWTGTVRWTRRAASSAADRLGPPGYRQAASFGVDEEAQTFVELEGGGKQAFTQMMRDGLYAAYTWRVRHFKEGETNETTIRFTPDGTSVRLCRAARKKTPGAALPAAGRAPACRSRRPRARWHVDLRQFALVEQGQERRPGGRVDHTLHLRAAVADAQRGALSPASGRLRRSPDRAHATSSGFRRPSRAATRACARRTRRSASARSSAWRCSTSSAASASACSSCCGGGCVRLAARRWSGVSRVGLLQGLAALNELPLIWMTYDTALPRSTFFAQQIADHCRDLRRLLRVLRAVVHGRRNADAARVRSPPAVVARVGRGPGQAIDGHPRAHGRRLSARVGLFFAYDVAPLSGHDEAASAGGPRPKRCCTPTCSPRTRRGCRRSRNSFQAGFWEECALPRRAARGRRAHRRSIRAAAGCSSWSASSSRRSSSAPDTRRIRISPSFARPVELIIPSIGFGLLVRLLRSAARHHPALHLRRGLVRAADLHGERARDLVPAA